MNDLVGYVGRDTVLVIIIVTIITMRYVIQLGDSEILNYPDIKE